MADRRLLLLDNAKAALEVVSVNLNAEVTTKPANLNVEKHRTRGADISLLPDISIDYAGETLKPFLEGAVDVSERDVRLALRCRAVAADGETGDEALLPILAWAELALLRDFTLGGVASFGYLDRIGPMDPKELADTFVGAVPEFVFTVPTKWRDPRQAP